MSWEQQSYSFGNPNAQPPTPTRTPTSLVFPSPTFQTPQASSNNFDNRSGWTPIFAAEYPTFNDPPQQQAFAETSMLTPRPSTSSSQIRPLSTEDLAIELASHVHHLSPQSNLPLPPVDSSRQLSSSPGPAAAHGGRGELKNTRITPRRPPQHLDGESSGQTATPPQSASKESRRLAPKLEDLGKMQRDQESFIPSLATPTQMNSLNFSSMDPLDMFPYPMSAPATAPAFTHTKPFWDPDNNMASIDIDFSSDPSLFDTPSSHRLANPIDWGRNNEHFPQSSGIPSFTPELAQSSSRQRPLLSKPQAQSFGQSASGLSFDFGMVTMSEDPFSAAAASGAVDPGLIFGLPQPSSSTPAISFESTSTAPPTRPTSGPVAREPYQHQLRESRRDEEELRRSRSVRDVTTSSRYERPQFNSNSTGIRPGLHRSFSDSRQRKYQGQKPMPKSNSGRISGGGELRVPSSVGGQSPLKHHSHPSLAAIPEATGFNARTAITFSIDANGRAHTEAVIVDNQSTTSGVPQKTDDIWASPRSGSSTDDDPITIPSKRASLTALDPRISQKLLRYETSGQSVEGSRRSSFVGNSASRDDESEAETVIEFDDGSGDAANALRKIMEGRKQGSSKQAGLRHHIQPKDSSQKFLGQLNPQHIQYGNQLSSSNISPTTVTDPDLATPSTDRGSSRSDSTRCVCNSREGDGFMIQCESCEKWLHASCVGVTRQRLPKVYICAFCAQTPNMRGGRMREHAGANTQLGSSPLAHKSFQSWR